MSRETAIGFTGTGHQPLTAYQRTVLETELREAWREGFREFHHGDCVHADEEAHNIAYAIGYDIVIHPPTNDYKRAFCGFTENRYGLHVRVTVLPAKDFISRNHDIVDASRRMLACPKEFDEQLRSGTWATIRYARKRGNMWHIIYPEAG